MAAAKKEAEQTLVPESVMEALNGVAKMLGVAVTELWTIFVRQYVVKGITEVFTGAVLCVASYFLYGKIGLFILIPLALALVCFYSAIQLIGNPRYHAISDISDKVKSYRREELEREIAKKKHSLYDIHY